MQSKDINYGLFFGLVACTIPGFVAHGLSSGCGHGEPVNYIVQTRGYSVQHFLFYCSTRQTDPDTVAVWRVKYHKKGVANG